MAKPFTKEQYEKKHRHLEDMPWKSTVTGIDGTVWTREWGDLWVSSKPARLNSLALVSELNPIPPAAKPDKREGMGESLFDL